MKGEKNENEDEYARLAEMASTSPYLADLEAMGIKPEGEPRGDQEWLAEAKAHILKPFALKLKLDGYSYPQIAEVLDRSVESIHRWISDTLEKRKRDREELGDLMIQVCLDQLYECRNRLQRIADKCKRHQEKSEGLTASIVHEERQAVKDLMRVTSEIRELLGLDAPKEQVHRHEGNVEYDLNLNNPNPDQSEPVQAETVDEPREADQPALPDNPTEELPDDAETIDQLQEAVQSVDEEMDKVASARKDVDDPREES